MLIDFELKSNAIQERVRKVNFPLVNEQNSTWLSVWEIKQDLLILIPQKFIKDCSILLINTSGTVFKKIQHPAID